MVIRGESTLEQIDTIATNEKFRIRPLSESLATSSDGPNAGFLRYLATEPTVVDALAYSGATSPESFGRDPVTPRVTNPDAYRHLLEALRLGYVEISDEAEPIRAPLGRPSSEEGRLAEVTGFGVPQAARNSATTRLLCPDRDKTGSVVVFSNLRLGPQ